MSFQDLTSCVQESIKDAFGESVVYEPLSGGSFTIQGVFNDQYTSVDPDTEQVVSSQVQTCGVKDEDLPTQPKKGDRIRIRGKQYRISDARPDGEGWTELFLWEGEP